MFHVREFAERGDMQMAMVARRAMTWGSPPGTSFLFILGAGELVTPLVEAGMVR